MELADRTRTRPHECPRIATWRVFVLAALQHWWLPEARLLAVWSLMTQTPVLYEAVSPFLIPKTWWEAVLLTAMSFACALTVWAGHPYASYDAWLNAAGIAMLWWVYMPCALMVLIRGRR